MATQFDIPTIIGGDPTEQQSADIATEVESLSPEEQANPALAVSAIQQGAGTGLISTQTDGVNVLREDEQRLAEREEAALAEPPEPFETPGGAEIREKDEEGNITNVVGTELSLEEALEAFPDGDFTGVTLTDKGTFVVSKDALERSTGITGLESEDTELEEKSEDVERITDQLDALGQEALAWNINTDPEFAAISAGITGQFNEIRRKMEQINKSRAAALRSLGFRSGTRQFAGAIQLSIEGAELSQASARISKISADEAAAMSAARGAFRNGKFAEFNQKMGILDTLRDNKAEELKAYNDKLIAFKEILEEENKVIQDQIIQSTRDTAISDLMKQGITDPNTILDFLNFDESGNRVGDFTAEEVSKTIEFLTPPEDKDVIGTNYLKLISSGQRLQAHNLMTKITRGKGTTEFKEGISNDIAEGLFLGKTLDEIEDEIRFSSVSPEFREKFERIFASATSKITSPTAKETARDSLDEFISIGDIKGAAEFILTLARDKAGANELTRLIGREEAEVALEDIREGLKAFQEAGGETGFFSGTAEQIAQKVGRTTDLRLADIAVRVEFAIQAYRQAISGAAFTEAEKIEYKGIYPSIKNVPELNEVKINALLDVNAKFVNTFYNRQLGTNNYAQVKSMIDAPTPKEIVFPNQSFNSLDELVINFPSMLSVISEIDSLDPTLTDSEILLEIESLSIAGFSGVGSDTKIAVNAPIIGTISGLPSFDTFNTYPGVNRSDRNNNPGNIKVTDFSKGFPGVVGVEDKPAEDSGNFLIFDSPESGANAVGELLKVANPYQGVSAEQAIKRYNGNGGYGARDVGLDPSIDFQSQIEDPIILRRVVARIMELEGFTGINTNLV